MRRRQFISLIGGAVAGWPLVARAQQSAMPVIGFLNGSSPAGYAHMVAAFREGLRQTGYVEGQNVAIEYRWAEGHLDRLPELSADLVRHQVAVIAATSTPANLVAKNATSTIPIVFTTGSDPVRIGLVSNLARPSGNVTGVTQLSVEILPKRIELAHELVPAATAIALLFNPTDPITNLEEKAAKAAASALGLQLHILQASTEAELIDAFDSVVRMRAGVFVIATSVLFNGRIEQIAALATRHMLPTIYAYREFVTAGGLISYGPELTDSYRLAGIYTGRILKGEKPSELPVQQATKVELLVNLKAARALNLAMPQALLARADEVIE
jgi:putative tryptophan/tyrosine transport system substrate-binding protein